MILISLLAMAAAPPPAEHFPDRGDSRRKCEAAHLARLVGRKRGPAVEKEALRLSGAGIVRWIRPGEMVTMDYRTDRLNLRVDGHGRILRADCG
jgi:hypothetical protein